MPYLLDTNHCSYIINGNTKVINTSKNYSDDVMGISIITYTELLYMTEKSTKKVENLLAVEAFLDDVDIYFIDKETSLIYSRVKALVFNTFAPKEKSKRRRTSIMDLGFSDHDLWIVATAIQHNLTLVSADGDFQRINRVQPFLLSSWI